MQTPTAATTAQRPEYFLVEFRIHTSQAADKWDNRQIAKQHKV